ncbi:MAG: (2Fe-2S)-binding protein, partial [Traorella sp.]
FSKRMFFAHRVKNVVISECSDSEKNRYIQHNPRYGKMVCRCEQVSEGEIVDCIRRKCGARSVVAVKKRVRAGMGRCQGGFCEPLIVQILARELSISPCEVNYNGKDSPILMNTDKGGPK